MNFSRRRSTESRHVPASIGWPSVYTVTLPGHPPFRCRLAQSNGMPFGLQIVGPRGGDAFVLSVAAELEALLAGDQRTARPVPDLARLKVARPISEMPGFLGFETDRPASRLHQMSRPRPSHFRTAASGADIA